MWLVSFQFPAVQVHWVQKLVTLVFFSFFFLIPNKCTRLLSEQVCVEHDSPKICVGHCSCNTFYSIVCISHLQATHVFQNKFVFSCNEAISDCEGVGLFSLQHNVQRVYEKCDVRLYLHYCEAEISHSYAVTAYRNVSPVSEMYPVIQVNNIWFSLTKAAKL